LIALLPPQELARARISSISPADCPECLMVRFATLAACALSLALNLPAFAQAPISAGQALPLPDQAIGQRFEVRVDALPKPYESTAVRNTVLTTSRGDRKPSVPEGFEVALFAESLPNPRQALVLPNGDLMVVSQGTGTLLLLRDGDKDGRAEWIQRFAGGFNRPNGLAYRNGELLVADQDGIWRLRYTEGSVRTSGSPPRSAAEVPPEQRRPEPMDGQQLLTAKGVFGPAQGHSNRDIEIGPDGRLYVGVGSLGNIGVEPEPKATIQVFSADGKEQRTLAAGLRNPVGLAFHPETGALWASVQERDGVGDRLVPDFLTQVKEGGFYGYPYAYIGPNPQPEFAGLAPDKVKSTLVPDLLFEPHSAAMDFLFWQGERVPPAYRGDAIVALKGSWNRTDPTGYKVVRVKFEGGRPAGWYDNFMTGFWVEGTDTAVVWGRPAEITQAPDGTLYVIDDTGGTIWRVTTTAASPDVTSSTRPRP
jgi:glucose/arabinose dehydrogenase